MLQLLCDIIEKKIELAHTRTVIFYFFFFFFLFFFLGGGVMGTCRRNRRGSGIARIFSVGGHWGGGLGFL